MPPTPSPARGSSPADGSRRRPGTPGRWALAIALVGALAVLAMHGVTSHAAGPGHEAGGAAGGPAPTDIGSAAHPHAVPTPGAPLDDRAVHHHDGDRADGRGDHHDDEGGRPCPSCAQGAASLCALVVLSAVFPPRRPAGSISVLRGRTGQPTPGADAPDPPVPRPPLVPTS